MVASTGSTQNRISKRRTFLPLALLLGLSLLCASALWPRASQADPLNLAQGKVATALSTESAVFPASAAVDGDPGTRWASGAGDPQWLQVDLGATQSIGRVVLRWETAYASAYHVEVAGSTAGPWTSIYATTSAGGGVAEVDYVEVWQKQ